MKDYIILACAIVLTVAAVKFLWPTTKTETTEVQVRDHTAEAQVKALTGSLDSAHGVIADLTVKLSGDSTEKRALRSWAGRLQGLVASLGTSNESLKTIIASIDTVIKSPPDSAGRVYADTTHGRYDIGRNLWWLKSNLEPRRLIYGWRDSLITTTKYEKYVAWEWVAGFGGILALLLHLITK